MLEFSHFIRRSKLAWKRHDMETLAALLALCGGTHRLPVYIPYKGLEIKSVDVSLYSPEQVNSGTKHSIGSDLANIPLSVLHVWMFWPHFYQTKSAWSVDQGSSRKCSAVHNFAPTVTKFCFVWEGWSLPHDTKFGKCRDEIADTRVIFIWSLIHRSSWSGLLTVGPWLWNNLHDHYKRNNSFTVTGFVIPHTL